MRRFLGCVLAIVLSACGSGGVAPVPDAGSNGGRDSGSNTGADSGQPRDAGSADSGSPDSGGPQDAGSPRDGGGEPVRVAYAIIPQCDLLSLLGMPTSVAASHEIIEATTDPWVNDVTANGYYMDQSRDAWLAITAAEVGDVCALLSSFQQIATGSLTGTASQYTESGYTVQRSFSNTSALAGHDPCVPVLSGAYFNMAPSVEDLVMDAGDTQTITLTGYSDQPTSDWNVKAVDFGSLTNPLGTPVLNLTLDQSTANNGSTLHLTIQAQGTIDPQNGEAFVVISYDSSGNHIGFWPGLVHAANSDAGFTMPDAGPWTAPGDGGYPAAHFPLALMAYGGDPLLYAPKIVTVTFPNDSNSPTAFEGMDDALPTTQWWDEVTQGYCSPGNQCIGHGSGGGHVHMSTNSNASYSDTAAEDGGSDIKDFIRQQVANGTFPAPDSNTLYAIYFPSSTTITLTDQGQTATSCQQFGGYHSHAFVTPP